jgi:hypothetical protein
VAQLGARLDGIEEVEGSNPFGSTKVTFVQSGEMLYRTFRRHTLHFWAEGIFERFEHARLQIEVPQIIIHKTHQLGRLRLGRPAIRCSTA